MPDPAPPAVSRASWRTRIFINPQYFRLWCAQVVSAMGDWMGFLAIAVAATRVGGGSEGVAVGLAMSARIVPGFFLGPAAGVLVDRWDRKKVMVVCDIGRAFTLFWLPFIDHLWQLLLGSLILEAFTMMWSPAKEASVPNLVPADRLTDANSLNLVAAYGTFPIASLIFALLAEVAQALGTIDALSWMGFRQESVAFWFDTLTFLFSALLISRLALPRLTRHEREAEHEKAPWTQAFAEMKEGWSYIFINPVVRAVNLGLAVALIGGGMLVPLGPVFADTVLGAGSPGFGVLTMALGLGVAAGVLGLSATQKRLPKARMFTVALFAASASLAAAASVSILLVFLFCVFLLGASAGAVYVLGFTLIHESVSDELRGRVFGGLYTLVRLCVLIAFAVGPLLADLLDRISRAVLDDARFEVAGASVFVPGVRITMWLAALIIAGAGVLAVRSVRQAIADGLLPAGAGPINPDNTTDGAPSSGGHDDFDGNETHVLDAMPWAEPLRTDRGDPADPHAGSSVTSSRSGESTP